jgi:hypothetical protein
MDLDQPQRQDSPFEVNASRKLCKSVRMLR